MNIHDFRSNPLPNRIIHALLSATQAHSEVNVLMNEYPENNSLLTQMLVALDVFYHLYDDEIDIANVCRALFIPDKTSMISRTIETFTNCATYAKDKTATREILTAGDVLKINSALKAASTEPLLFDTISDDYEQLVKPIWLILNDLYAPQRQYTLLMETAITCYRLLMISETDPIRLQTLTILFSVVYQNEFIFYGLSRQWNLSTDPKIDIASLDIVSALVHILKAFQQMWAYTAILLRVINSKKVELIHLISEDFSQQVSTGIIRVLSESLCIKKRDAEEKLCLSPKTVAKHLTFLEQKSILCSIKNWREVLYFNNVMIDALIKQI
ncbi:MAG: hypothetical protein FWG94_03775 [Oscillospiraceae bacterium]|nr:hypothetical protein [Oscillospiraceae bacterium]